MRQKRTESHVFRPTVDCHLRPRGAYKVNLGGRWQWLATFEVTEAPLVFGVGTSQVCDPLGASC